MSSKEELIFYEFLDFNFKSFCDSLEIMEGHIFIAGEEVIEKAFAHIDFKGKLFCGFGIFGKEPFNIFCYCLR